MLGKHGFGCLPSKGRVYACQAWAWLVLGKHLYCMLAKHVTGPCLPSIFFPCLASILYLCLASMGPPYAWQASKFHACQAWARPMLGKHMPGPCLASIQSHACQAWTRPMLGKHGPGLCLSSSLTKQPGPVCQAPALQEMK